MSLTKAELLVLKDYHGGIRANAHQLGVNPRVVMSLHNKGYLRSCNWSRKQSEIDMRITPEGILELAKETEE